MTPTTLPRRTVLKALAAAGVSAAGVAGCTADEPSSAPGTSADATQRLTPGTLNGTTAPTMPDLSDWGTVRGAFAFDPDVAQFAAFVLAGHPGPVRDAISAARDELDTDTALALGTDFDREQLVRSNAASYLGGVAPDDIALTGSTTMGLGLVYGGLRLKPGDHVLTTTHDFYSTHEALRLAAAASGASVHRVALYDDPRAASTSEIVSRLRGAITPQTRVVGLTWVHSSTGVKLPMPEIADVIASANRGRPEPDRAILVVDAVHGFGCQDAGPAELGCDVFVSGTHKWIFGPRGTGLVWAAPSVRERITPVIPAFNAPSFGNWLSGGDVPSPFGLGCSPGGYHAFEHRWAVAEAFDFHLAIGRGRVAERTTAQASQLKAGLATVDGVSVVTPEQPELSAGIVCCAVAGRDAAAVSALLGKRHGISASVTPYREQYVRFGPSIVTTPEEVDQLVEAMSDLA